MANISNRRSKKNYRSRTVVRKTIRPQNSPPKKLNRRRLRVVDTNNQVNQRPRPIDSPPSSLASRVINTVFRVTIVGVGMGTLFGSFLANRDLTKPLFPQINLPELPFINKILPSQSQSASEEQIAQPEAVVSEQAKPKKVATSSVAEPEIKFTEELSSLKEKLNQLNAKYPQLEASAFFVDLDNGAYVNLNGIKAFSAASTIKIPVLIAFLQDVDAGKVYLDEELTMTKSNRAGGSGGMQYKSLGSKYSAIETATQMIITSDNSATNMIIERLGGAAKLNKRFEEWGLENTQIQNPLPDLEGTNTVSTRDLTMLLAKINQGQLLSVRSRDRLFDIMKRTKTRTLLPQGIEPEARIAHKTGDIGTVLGDAGIIDMPSGKRYIAAVMVARPHNDPNARTLIQEISHTAYQHFKWYLARPEKNHSHQD